MPSALNRWVALGLSILVAPGCTPGYPEPTVRQDDARQSAKPGINDAYRVKDLDVEEWSDRFEVESREIFAHRHAIVAAAGFQSGATIADIGAGTGLFTMLFAEATGPYGRLYAVDIVPKFLEHIDARTRKAGVSNVTTVLCKDDSVELPRGSIDAAFICDAYHHFEYPNCTMRSLHRAMKLGSTLIVIDFERIEGVSRDWILGHVRAGKDRVIEEITSNGFALMGDAEIPGLEENYFLRFTKTTGATK